MEPFIPVTLPPPNTTFIAKEDLGDETLETTTILTPELFEVPEHNGSLIIFDRIYDEGKGKKKLVKVLIQHKNELLEPIGC